MIGKEADSTPGLTARVVRKVHPGLTLDVEIAIGEACAILFGASGSGKTSLLRMIAGLDRPDSGTVVAGGQVWFDSREKIDLPLRARHLGMIFQDDLLFPHLSVAANVRFGLAKLDKTSAGRRVAEVAELCGIGHLLGRWPETLSGGERQRVGLARALAPRPRVLLCDEPVSALDLDARFLLIRTLRAIQEAEKLPILYVTHSPAEAVALGGRGFTLESGRIGDEGEILDVLSRRKIGSMTRMDDLRNVFPGVIEGHAPDAGETFVRLDGGGPVLVVPHHGREVGSRAVVSIRGDEILLARGPIRGLSARNVISGTVERVVSHGGDAEVVVRVGGVVFVVSVVAPAVSALEITRGAEVHLIMKARSCHLL